MIKTLDYTYVAHSAMWAQDNTESLLDGLQIRFSYMGGDPTPLLMLLFLKSQMIRTLLSAWFRLIQCPTTWCPWASRRLCLCLTSNGQCMEMGGKSRRKMKQFRRVMLGGEQLKFQFE
jgi:hypothetical protein